MLTIVMLCAIIIDGDVLYTLLILMDDQPKMLTEENGQKLVTESQHCLCYVKMGHNLLGYCDSI